MAGLLSPSLRLHTITTTSHAMSLPASLQPTSLSWHILHWQLNSTDSKSEDLVLLLSAASHLTLETYLASFSHISRASELPKDGVKII